MRDFFILWFERLISVIMIIATLIVVIGSVAVLVQAGFLAFLGVLLGGAVYLILIGGAMYLGLGIYQNTKKSAELLERIAAK